MRREEFARLVDSCRCVPGMRIHYEESMKADEAVIWIDYETIDADLPDNRVPIHVQSIAKFPHCLVERWDLRTALEAVRETARNLLLHELDEWFRVGGKRVREPHPERTSRVPAHN